MTIPGGLYEDPQPGYVFGVPLLEFHVRLGTPTEMGMPSLSAANVFTALQRVAGGATPGTPAATDVLIGAGGIKTGAGITTGGPITVNQGTSVQSLIVLGELIGTGWSGFKLYTGASHKAWSIGSQNIVNEALDFTPSTAAGGGTFTTPVFVITNDLSTNGIGIYSAGYGYFGATAPVGAERVRVAGGSAPATPASTDVLIGAGEVKAGAAIRSTGATSGIGYATGAGSTVTQATSKATSVSLSNVCGTITMNGAALASVTSVAFTWTNTAIAATDMVLIQHDSVGTLGGYSVVVTPAAGSATVTVRNNTAGSLSEAIVLRFIVIKAVTA